MIKGMGARLQRIGNIKIGRKGEVRRTSDGREYRVPVKDDYFTVTTMDRDDQDNWVVDKDAMKALGDKPLVIPIFLPYDDIDKLFPNELAIYKSSQRWCHGDRETAERIVDDEGTKEIMDCPCELLESGHCKPHGILNVVLAISGRIGGVHQFRTTSWNSIENILSSLALLKSLTGGPLAGIPLQLVVGPKKVQPKGLGKFQIVQVVSIEFRRNAELSGSTLDQLQEASRLQTQARLTAGSDIKRLAAASDGLNADTPEDKRDYGEEFTSPEHQQENGNDPSPAEATEGQPETADNFLDSEGEKPATEAAPAGAGGQESVF